MEWSFSLSLKSYSLLGFSEHSNTPVSPLHLSWASADPQKAFIHLNPQKSHYLTLRPTSLRSLYCLGPSQTYRRKPQSHITSSIYYYFTRYVFHIITSLRILWSTFYHLKWGLLFNLFHSHGFHGLHVVIGSTFLIVCFRQLKFHFTSNHYFGFEAVAWYWHFVDIVCGEGNGIPLQYSYLENPMDGGAW